MINIAIAERYDVKVKIDFTENVWIRAVSLANKTAFNETESVFAKLQVGGNQTDPPELNKYPTFPESTEILNCYSFVEVIGGNCHPVTDLVPTVKRNHIPSVAHHTFDIKVIFDPADTKKVKQFNVSIDHGELKKNIIPSTSLLQELSKSDQEKILHDINLLSLPKEESVTIIIRSTTRGFHPIHMHGHHFEVLEIANKTKTKNENCALLSTENYFGQTIEKLMNRKTQGVLKDAVILPACGAVAIRINSDNPGVWFFHCHIDKHMYKGLAAVIDENNFMFHQTSFPQGYPSCDENF